MRKFTSIPDWVEENMSKQPKKDDSVFRLDPRGARTNLSLHLSNDPEYVCARGYLLAARLSVERVLQDRMDRPFLVYPIVFLYRHHVELMLKRLILKADEAGVRYYTDTERLSDDVREKLTQRHSLQWLWDQFRPVVQALGNGTVPARDIAGINSYIRQLHEVDPNSVDFRYATAIEETKARLERVQEHGGVVGVQTFAEAMERLANYLEGLDSYFDDAIDGYHQMLADSAESYDSY